jgi:cobalt-zinc-cadmium efflux system protein
MTYGYHRIGVLIALFNAFVIVAIAAVILYEAIKRMGQPPEVDSLPMMIVAAAGLAVNVFVALWLRKDSRQNINVRSAFWHAAGDALASVGVIVGGIIIYFTGWNIVDPVIAVLISIILVSAAWGIIKDGMKVILEATPSHIEMDNMVKTLLELPGVKNVHRVHVWSITPEIHAMSGHVLIDDQAVSKAAVIQKKMEKLLREKFDIEHCTLQLECENCEAAGVLCSLRSGHDECPEHHNHSHSH